MCRMHLSMAIFRRRSICISLPVTLIPIVQIMFVAAEITVWIEAGSEGMVLQTQLKTLVSGLCSQRRICHCSYSLTSV
jgi:hypothetical protein